MFALHTQHRELENRRKGARFCYKKVAAKRFVKVFNRVGRKQFKLQIFPLFHTYPFKAENPPPLQLLQYPRGSSGFISFLPQPLRWGPDLTMAQGANSNTCPTPGHAGTAGARATGRVATGSKDGQNHLPCFSNTPGCRNLLPPLTWISPERTEVTTGYGTVSVLWGERVVPCVSTVPDWKE